MPVPEPHLKGVKPFPDAGLAGMNLLASTDQAHHDRPGFVPVEVRDQEFRFRPVEVRKLLPSTHEIRRLRLRPRALRLVEDDDVVVGSVRRPDALISEVVNVLDEGLHSLANNALSLAVADARELIARERLLEDRHERTIAGEIHGACFTERPPTCRNVQAYERLAGTRHARDEDDGFLAIAARAR